MMRKEADVKQFQISYWNLPVETEKHHEQTIRIYSFRTKIYTQDIRNMMHDFCPFQSKGLWISLKNRNNKIP